MLHTVNKSPFERPSLRRCLALARAGSAVLLIEDGVYAAVRGTVWEAEVREGARRCALFALEPDLRARGLDAAQLIDGISLVDYGGFVDLAVEHDKVLAWL